MRSIALYAELHQPWRLRDVRFFDIGKGRPWFDDDANAAILRRVARRCYVPALLAVRQAAARTGGAFRMALSVSGTAMAQLARWSPETVDLIARLAAEGTVELLGETSHHSLAFVFDADEHDAQVRAHREAVEAVFGVRPTTFRATELALSTQLAQHAASLGYTAMLGEGAARLLGWRSPHRLYEVDGADGLRLILRSHVLSDDVAFRFLDPRWGGRGLSVRRYARWLADLPLADDVVGLFLDLETFGEHLDADTGILDFLAGLPEAVLGHGLGWATPAELAPRPSVAPLVVDGVITWADEARDLSAWLGNDLQRAACTALYRHLPAARAAAEAGAPELLDAWRRLSTSDHVYYMSTKTAGDGEVHRYFSPYGTPHAAFVTFMNVIDDLSRRLRAAGVADVARSPQPAPARTDVDVVGASSGS